VQPVGSCHVCMCVCCAEVVRERDGRKHTLVVAALCSVFAAFPPCTTQLTTAHTHTPLLCCTFLFLWLLGSVVLHVALYLLVPLTGASYSVNVSRVGWSFSLAIVYATVSTHGLPPVLSGLDGLKTYALAVARDESLAYILYTVAIVSMPPNIFAIAPLGLVSFFHALGFVEVFLRCDTSRACLSLPLPLSRSFSLSLSLSLARSLARS
jgi:hypothetical protein